jgi:outer membrane biogenesis lipoprotein LolB
MKLTEKFKETLIYAFLLLVLSFMLLGCNVKLSKRNKTQDELQMQFFKEQIKIKQYYYAKK